MKKISLLFALLFSMLTFSQIKFVPGSYIDNAGNKVSCLIRDLGWKANPKQFDYKLTEDSDIKVGTLKLVKEFEVTGDVKFVRATVMIDRSTDNLNALTYVKDPTFVEDQVFLKQIVAGKANLYQYEEPNFLRFFYNKEDGKIDQLVYKRYQVDTNSVTYNEGFKDQLQKDLVCSSVDSKKINNLNYKPESLKNLFLDYNRCSDPSFVETVKEVGKSKFHISIRPRVNFNQYTATDTYFDFNTTLASKTAFSAGIEAEYVFPFNKNKWALIVEPSYQYYKDEGTQDAPNIGGRKLITAVDFTAIDVPIGFRYYMYLGQDSRLFINALYVTSIKIGKNIELQRSDSSVFNTFDVFPRANFAAGIGYSYKEKVGVEFRVNSNNSIAEGTGGYTTKFKSSSLILSYTLF